MIPNLAAKLRSGVGITTASAWISRVITAALQILSVRAAIFLVGTDQYSIIAIIVGLQAWFLLLDFGGSFSFLNFASDKQAVGKRAQDCLACAIIWSLASLLVGTVLLNILAAPLANWLFQKGGSFTNSVDAETALRFGGTLFIVFANTQLVPRLWLVEGRGYLANMLPVLGASITLLAFELVPYFKVSHIDIIAATVILCLPNAAIQLLFLAWVSLRRKINLLLCDKHTLKNFGKRALQAFVFSSQAAITLQVDYIILSQLAKPEDIVIYSIFSRVFILLSFVYTSVLTSIWPVISYNIMHREVERLRQGIKYLFIGGTVFIAAASAGVYVFERPLLSLMTHGRVIDPPRFLVILMGLNQLAVLWVSILSQIMQVAGRLKIMINATFFQLAISVSLQYWLTTRLGIIGIVAGVLLSFLIGGLVPLVFFVRRFLTELAD